MVAMSVSFEANETNLSLDELVWAEAIVHWRQEMVWVYMFAGFVNSHLQKYFFTTTLILILSLSDGAYYSIKNLNLIHPSNHFLMI